MSADAPRPVTLDLDRATGLSVVWNDGTQSFYPVAHLRKHSPSADSKMLRQEMARNPLTVLPARAAGAGPLSALRLELVGNYAMRVHFSDGHSTGIYSWSYLRSIDPEARPGPTGMSGPASSGGAT